MKNYFREMFKRSGVLAAIVSNALLVLSQMGSRLLTFSVQLPRVSNS